jgi:PGF-CTERM protein
MKLWKSSVIVIGISALMLMSVNVVAVSDGTNDVWHQAWTGTGYKWEAFSGSKPSIDITDLSYSIEGSTATVTMTTVGDMTPNTENVVYTMHLRSGESNFYMIIYTNGQGAVTGMGNFMGYAYELDNPISGNTFIASFEIDDPTLDYEVIGFNVESSDPDAEHGEAWWDYAPNTEAPYYGTNGNGGNGDGGDGDGNGGDGTPGFEALAVIAAFGAAFILLRRRK